MKLRFLDTIQQAYDHAFTVDREIDDMRAVIFSDHHRGIGDRADDYRFASETYSRALDHYLENDVMLVLLGDVEELWENSKTNVIKKYQAIMEKERLFEKRSNYFRIWGNHDSDWSREKEVQKHLGINAPAYESVRIRVTDNGESLGHLFLIHGHQGTVFSDQYARLGKFFVRYFWRHIQSIFNMPLNTAATNTMMRSKHDRRYYKWALEHNHDLVVITGHTHEPVFNSFT
jgi:UDP-2,3-diacylglucosamine pyrophosphatase LpxH